MEIGNQFLGTERIDKLMRQYAVPCIISLLVGALYNIVDQIFIANASYLGSYENAANTVVFPLTVVALAIAVMVGDGCCAFHGAWLHFQTDCLVPRMKIFCGSINIRSSQSLHKKVPV